MKLQAILLLLSTTPFLVHAQPSQATRRIQPRKSHHVAHRPQHAHSVYRRPRVDYYPDEMARTASLAKDEGDDADEAVKDTPSKEDIQSVEKILEQVGKAAEKQEEAKSKIVEPTPSPPAPKVESTSPSPVPHQPSGAPEPKVEEPVRHVPFIPTSNVPVGNMTQDYASQAAQPPNSAAEPAFKPKPNPQNDPIRVAKQGILIAEQCSDPKTKHFCKYCASHADCEDYPGVLLGFGKKSGMCIHIDQMALNGAGVTHTHLTEEQVAQGRGNCWSGNPQAMIDLEAKAN